MLAALAGLDSISLIHVASRQGLRPSDVESFFGPFPHKVGRLFENYADALNHSGARLAYVSLPNALHEPWVERALAHGYHVVVDKPAFTSFDVAHRLCLVASQRNLLLAEANTWDYHPQVDEARAFFDKPGRGISRILVAFTFPPLPPQDFRYRREFGGGSLLDIGPYAVSVGRVFLGSEPADISCHVLERSDSSGSVDTSFSVLMTYAPESAVAGHFGFTTEYVNSVSLIGPGGFTRIERVFSPPPDLALTMDFRSDNAATVKAVGPADSFALFLRAVLDAIDHNEFGDFRERLLSDSRVLSRLREAADSAERGQRSE